MVLEEIPSLPQTTLAAAHANALEMMKIRVAASQDLRQAVSDLERFTGETGELNHFLKGGDRLIRHIEAKAAENLINPEDAEALKAALICRVKRRILNQIQADEETPWTTVKERLKKAYGSGRWTPEEDIFQMFREVKLPRQSNGQYAAKLLAQYNQITEKMRESMSVTEANGKMAFLATIWKVQLARETGKKDGLPMERSFVECAQDMVDASAREEDVRMETEDGAWNRVMYKHPRPQVNAWKRREPTFERKDRTGSRDRKPFQTRMKTNGRRIDRRCHGCGKVGHLVAQCPQTQCFECGMEGHIARQCPYIYSSSRKDQHRGEPMEVNVQRLGRRRTSGQRNGSTTETTDESETSETEEEISRPGRSSEGDTKVQQRGTNSRRWGVDRS